MKKILAAWLTLIFLCACEGPVRPPEEQTQWKSVYYTVKEADWRLVGRPDALNSFYQYSFEEPSLTDFIYEEGVVMGYEVANYGTRDELLRPLPDTWPVGEDGMFWTESVSFEYKPGLVTFCIGYSDFATSVRPLTKTFKLMMIW
ncbi:MAG: hypothetical protein LBS05_04510 [Tannerellaceae bacterium]|jgi:hypothetical protein|nr:hypothetical protein [Tannerellaceae bacterium]